MLVGPCSSELSGHQPLKEIKKVTTSDRSAAYLRACSARDLHYADTINPTPNPKN
jgi:hypothetical protein